MMNEYAKVYSPDGAYLGLLENAKLQYTLKDVPLHSAKITLPKDDPKNALCQMGNEVELFDNGTRVELFRILSSPQAIYKTGGTITYNCEHVLAYLLQNVIFQYLELGGDGVYTADVLDYLLSLQTTTRWVRGTCDFALQAQYSFENKTVLQAVLAVANQITTENLFTFDTTVRPFVLNLINPATNVTFEMRYARNMTEITKSIDIENLVTRLYLLGYGEGVNQLTIKDINGGVPYLEADTIGTWGIHESIHQDGTIEDAGALKTIGEGLLEEYKDPYISYKGKMVDLFPVTGDPMDRPYPGKMGRINDQEYGILYTGRVTEISKKDVMGNPGEITVTIANKTRTASELIADLASRLSVSELNAQGNTVIYQVRYADNADKDHPASLPVEIPDECNKINTLRLRYKLSAFRSYSKGAAAGGGGATTSTTSAGASYTSGSGGGYYSNTLGITEGPNEFFGTKNYTAAGGDVSTSEANGYTGAASPGTSLNASSIGGASTTYTAYADGSVGSHHHLHSHTHDVDSHSHVVNSHTHTLGSHNHTGGSHTHEMWHLHDFTAVIVLPDHTHTVTISGHSHQVNLTNHTHENLPGIYEGDTVTTVVITVDGNIVDAADIEDETVDLTSYLSKDSNGKILRGIEHEIYITPQAEAENPEGNTRIEATLLVQTFVRSQGGGDY